MTNGFGTSVAVGWSALRRHPYGLVVPQNSSLPADAFVVTPIGRIADGARAGAEGGEARTMIAGYHWLTDWGRDTMISLEASPCRPDEP